MNAIEPLLEAAFWLMLDWSLRWGGLIGLLALWLGWRPPQRSEVRHALAWGVLVVGLGLPLVPLWGPGFWRMQASLARIAPAPTGSQHAQGRGDDAASRSFEQREQISAYVVRQEAAGNATAPVEQVTGDASLRTGGERTEPAPATVARPGIMAAREVIAAPRVRQLDARRLLVWASSGLYLGGVAWSLLRIVGGALLLARLRRTAREVDEGVRAALADGCARLRLSRPVRIAAHDAVRSPLVCGLFRPLILVPCDWTDVPAAGQRACLLHELAHIQRGDPRALVLTELVQAAFFFHPLVRWLVHRIDLEREFICDEIAASLHGQPQDYARILVDVAGRAGRFHAGPGRAALALPMSSRRTIAKRVNHLLDFPVTAGTLPLRRAWQWAIALAAILAGGGVGSLRLTAEAAPRPAETASPKPASEPSPPPTESQPPTPAGRVLGAGPFLGTVVDSRGKPVAQARVRLVRPQKERPPAVLQETASDPAGRFRIDAWQDTYIAKPGENFQWPSLIVSDPNNGRVGGLYTPYFRSENGPHEPLVRLLEVQQYQGRLVSADETPITGVRITAQAWHRGGQFYDRDSFEIPAELIEQWSAETDAQGQFVLRGVPAEGFLTVAIVAEEFGSPRANLSLTDPATIRLAQPVSLRGSVVAAGSTTGLAGIPIRIQPVESPAGGSERSFRVGMPASRWETVSDANGRFSFDVWPGKYEVAASPVGDQPYGAERGQVVVDSGKEPSLVLTLPKAVRIQGQVVDRENGQGLRGVRMSFSAVGKDGRQLGSRSTTTNDRGEYSVYTRGGKVRVYVDADGYARPDPKDLPGTAEVTADTTWPKIELTRKARVNIVVVDESGRPVPEAELDATNHERSSSTQHEVAPDRRGGFVLTTDQPAAAVQLRARSDTAACEGPVVMVPADVKDTVRIVLSETRCFVLTGKVVDDTGAPVPHASLRVNTYRQRPNGATGLVCCTSVADGDGNFRIGGLWPGDGYQVQAEAPRHDKWASKSVQGVAGEVHELPAIVLQRATYVVAGQVVDARGTALADVRVFNAGDAPRLLTATTDAEGRFRLEGFRAGPAFVFAEKDGYRFTGLRPEAGAERLVIRLLREAEPTTPREPPARSGTPALARQRAVARQVLEELWSAENRNLVAYFGITSMARVDLARAVMWSEQMGEHRDDYATMARTENARCLALEGDLDGSLAVLAETHDYFAFLEVLKLADRFADTNPATADRFADDAGRFLKDMNESEQANAQAKLGGILLRLGHTAEGRRLVESAADAATRLGWTESATIARALACYDTTRALQFVPPETKPSEHSRSLANLAIAAARHDASQGRTLFESVARRYRYDERALAPVAYNMVLKAPEAAIQFVEAYGEGSRDLGRTARAQAPAWGWIAVAIADRDPERARSLIDRGLGLCVHAVSPWHDSDWDQYGGRPAQAALLAVQADMIGYPDMESICHRVLASRMAGDSGSGDLLWENVTQVALLALVQPELARDVLQILESRIARMKTGLLAWSLVAPDQFPDRARRRLAEAKDADERNRILSDILDVANVLTASPFDRPELIMRDHGGWWMPGKDS